MTSMNGMKSAVVSCSWLVINSMSGSMVHFALSWNYPEIIGCRQHLPALSVVSKVFIRVDLAEMLQFVSNSSFNVMRSLSAGLRPH